MATENNAAPAVKERQSGARGAVLATLANPAPDERVLLELAAGQLPLVELLEKAQLKAAERLVQLADQPNAAVAFARLLRETTAIQGSIGKRVAELMQAAANLRAQRRFLELNGKGGVNGD